MTRYEARKGLYAYSLATQAKKRGRRGQGPRRAPPRAGLRPPRDDRGAPRRRAARGVGVGECGVHGRSAGRAKMAGPRPARAACARGRAPRRRGGDRRADGAAVQSARRAVSGEGALCRSRAALSPRCRDQRGVLAGRKRPDRCDRPQQSRGIAPETRTVSPRPSRSIAARSRSTKRATGRIIPTWRFASTISRACSKPRTASPRPSRSFAARSRSTRRATGRIIPRWRRTSTISRSMLRDTNRLAEAEPLFRRALAIDEKSYVPDHPQLANRAQQSRRACSKTRTGSREAEPLYRRALAIGEASLGPDHPNVAIRLNNLASLLQDTNRLGEAEPLYRRALAI